VHEPIAVMASAQTTEAPSLATMVQILPSGLSTVSLRDAPVLVEFLEVHFFFGQQPSKGGRPDHGGQRWLTPFNAELLGMESLVIDPSSRFNQILEMSPVSFSVTIFKGMDRNLVVPACSHSSSASTSTWLTGSLFASVSQSPTSSSSSVIELRCTHNSCSTSCMPDTVSTSSPQTTCAFSLSISLRCVNLQ
jgi:hypothetical protein